MKHMISERSLDTVSGIKHQPIHMLLQDSISADSSTQHLLNTKYLNEFAETNSNSAYDGNIVRNYFKIKKESSNFGKSSDI